MEEIEFDDPPSEPGSSKAPTEVASEGEIPLGVCPRYGHPPEPEPSSSRRRSASPVHEEEEDEPDEHEWEYLNHAGYSGTTREGRVYIIYIYLPAKLERHQERVTERGHQVETEKWKHLPLGSRTAGSIRRRRTRRWSQVYWRTMDMDTGQVLENRARKDIGGAMEQQMDA